MSGLLYLSSEDFALQRGKKGPIMCHQIRGISLILFYSTHCEHCKELIPIFKSLPGTINGCMFGMINVSLNRACVAMSQNTIAPIKYVPYIVLYVDGKPFMAYKGPYQASELQKFVVQVAQNIQKKQQFSKDVVKQEEQKIPEYTIGIPVCGDDNVCYLDNLNAYKPG